MTCGALAIRRQGAVAILFGGREDGIRDGIVVARSGLGVIQRPAHGAGIVIREPVGKLRGEPGQAPTHQLSPRCHSFLDGTRRREPVSARVDKLTCRGFSLSRGDQAHG